MSKLTDDLTVSQEDDLVCKDGSVRNHLKAHQFTEGHKKVGGRIVGSKNKKTFREELANIDGLTPAEMLYSIMNDETANMGQRMKAAEKLIDFTEPKLSSVEIHTDEEHQAPFQIFLGQDSDLPKEFQKAVKKNKEEKESDSPETED